MQQRVDEINIRDNDDLRKRLMQTWFDFDQDITDTAIDQWRDHLRSCVRAGGGHFEHMVWHKCLLPAALRVAQAAGI